MSYVGSNDNRLYVGWESSYGQVPAVDAGNRIPAVRFTVKQQREVPKRRDKTGSRTFLGMPAGVRRRTSYELRTYLTGWSNQGAEPAYGRLFRAALGGAGRLFAGGTAGTGCSGRLLRFGQNQSLVPGQAVTCEGELRFVTSVEDAQAVELNAPFTVNPEAGAAIGPTVSYAPANRLGSVSVFEYWDPASALQRVLLGAAVDKVRIQVNGDYHEFLFSGEARDVIDDASFESGMGGLAGFPGEPQLDAFEYAIVPGHLGQVWVGEDPEKLLTLTQAELRLENGIELRSREFGADGPRSVCAGARNVELEFRIFEQDSASTKALYQAALQGTPVPVMFQLGQESGQMFGAYLSGLAPNVPEFDDGDTRVEWKFNGCRAQGFGDDELYVAFG